MIFPMADFQCDVQSKIAHILNSEKHSRAVVCMPTGSGKPGFASRASSKYVILNFEPGRRLLVVWMAQKEELLEQAAESLRQVWSSSSGVPSISVLKNFSVYRNGAEARWPEVRDAILTGPSIFTTPQSFNSLLREEIEHVTSS